MLSHAKFELATFHDAEALLRQPEDPAQPRTMVVFVGRDLAMGGSASAFLKDAASHISRAATAAKFKGKAGSSLEILAAPGVPATRLILMGVGAAGGDEPDGEGGEPAKPFEDFVALGGQTAGKIGAGARAIAVFDMPEGVAATPEAAAQFALGGWLRAYKFDHYKTKKKDEADREGPAEVLLATFDLDGAKTAIADAASLAEAVILARTLVNEPANVLTPAEFAGRAAELMKLGVEVEILDEKAMAELGMRALLGVGQGSEAESRLVVLRWNGGAEGVAPLAFVGKGVVFDSGGISIKPAASMEDMKGDMAGAAAVTGAMHAIAARKAKANVVGVLGLVENMPDGKAQRPGDIVKSMSGQTIEIVNTDAEGRLVLADALTYVIEKYKPTAVVDLATLTGAILVALGQEYCGLFSNNDELADRLTKSGNHIGEKLWRMPMGHAYDKLIDSKFADMKNTGGRHAGSITAAHFLQRFVGKTHWAHLDIAGTGMGSPTSDTNQSWGAGWGVRLLDRLVRDYYEA
ncbi:leucyl aminopeptidase [Methylocystis sp. 9N]|uniref:Probable cytosol aminopeptidase n=1 Tax=Methylocystis borbori TaxID=3118750 RepID=A0ABU7XE85_9HYPH